MWSFFIIGPAATAILSSVISMTGGMSFLAIAAAVSEIQRRGGYRPGEGPFTERAGDKYYGVCFDAKSEYDLNRDLAALLGTAQGLFKDLSKFKFDMTKSDAEMLRSMMTSALSAMGDIEVAKELAVETGDTQLLDDTIQRFTAAAHPVKLWMSNFPRKRFL